jgi:hypothetical protein
MREGYEGHGNLSNPMLELVGTGRMACWHRCGNLHAPVAGADTDSRIGQIIQSPHRLWGRF